MMKEGDVVLIVDPKKVNAEWLVQLEKGKSFSCHLGAIRHDDLLERAEFGMKWMLPRGQVWLLRPRPVDLIRHFRHATNVIHDVDAAMLVATLGVRSGMKVGEAGTGSGSFTGYLAQLVAPGGQVYSFDNREEHLALARRNLEKAGLLDVVTLTNHDVCEEDISIEDLEAFFLDLPTPWLAIPHVEPSLQFGARVISFVPNWSQVEQTVKAIENTPHLYLEEVYEVLKRPFLVKPSRKVMRPMTRMISFSGVAIHAIKLRDREVENS